MCIRFRITRHHVITLAIHCAIRARCLDSALRSVSFALLRVNKVPVMAKRTTKYSQRHLSTDFEWETRSAHHSGGRGRLSQPTLGTKLSSTTKCPGPVTPIKVRPPRRTIFCSSMAPVYTTSPQQPRVHVA